METPQTVQGTTVADAAERLGVSQRTVWRYIKAGRLTGRTIGEAGSQRTLVDDHSLDELRRARGSDPRAERYKAERDALAQRLAATEAERDALRARLITVRPAPRPLLDRILEMAFTLVGSIPARRRTATP